MRWYSNDGEFAFLAVGSTATGIIAVGGVAHGVVAFGGFLSVGFISIGMNAIGTGVAVGLNAAGPVSLSLINGLGVYVLAGVNGLGTWSSAGTNATGVAAHGGVNSNSSPIPTVVVVLALLVYSLVSPGERRPASSFRSVRFRDLLEGDGVPVLPVRARLIAVHADAVELVDRGVSRRVRADPQAVAQARELLDTSMKPRVEVLADLITRVETRHATGETGYRERPATSEEEVLVCVALAASPEPLGPWPASADELRWVLAWSARVAAIVAVVCLVLALR